MSKERIAIFARFLEEGGGLERVILNLVQGFTDRGYEVDLLLFTAEGPFMQFIPENVRIIDFGDPRILDSIPKLIQYFRQESPKVMYCAETDRGFAAVIAKFLTFSKTQIMIGIHALETKELPAHLDRKTKILQLIKRVVCPLATKTIPVSYGVGDDIMKDLGIPKRKIHVIYNPVVTEQLKLDMQQPVDHPWLQEKTIPVILAVGRLHAIKDYSTLLRAFKQVLTQCQARLIILGDGPERKKLTSLVEELDLGDHVDMSGFVDNPYPYMKHSDLLVLSSKFESFGNVLAEAMACGTPVVSTNCPVGPGEILNNGEYGTLVPVGDAQALGQAIVDALQQKHDIGKLQKRAEDFSGDKIVDQYLAAFQLN